MKDVDVYVKSVLKVVHRLHTRIFRTQTNISKLLEMMYTWAMEPVLQRDPKNNYLLAISEKDQRLRKRYELVETTARELDQVLEDNYKAIFDLLPESEYDDSGIDGDDGLCSSQNIIKFLELYITFFNCHFENYFFTQIWKRSKIRPISKDTINK